MEVTDVETFVVAADRRNRLSIEETGDGSSGIGEVAAREQPCEPGDSHSRFDADGALNRP